MDTLLPLPNQAWKAWSHHTPPLNSLPLPSSCSQAPNLGIFPILLPACTQLLKFSLVNIAVWLIHVF